MSVLLLKLNNVSEDEYNEVCDLLDQNEIAYYETNRGFWGVGLAAIWLYDPEQLEKAQGLLNTYTQLRQSKVREEIALAKQSGEFRTLASTFKQQPVTFLLYLMATIAILALSILPFLGFM